MFFLAPNLNVAVFPPKINDADMAINLTCTATVEEDVMLDQYVFNWILNDAPIYQFGERINVCNYIVCDTVEFIEHH